MKTFFKKLLGRGDVMTRADKWYYKKVFKTTLWSLFAFAIIAWVGTNLVLCALTTNVQNNFDIIYEATGPVTLPIGSQIRKAISDKKAVESSSYYNDDQVESVTFGKLTGEDRYKSIDLTQGYTKSQLLGRVFLYKSLDNKTVYILSTEDMIANEDCSDMFLLMSKLKTINFENFDTSKIKNMDRMFSTMSSLKTLDLSKFVCPQLSSTNLTFAGDFALTTVFVSEQWDIGAASGYDMFGHDYVFNAWNYFNPWRSVGAPAAGAPDERLCKALVGGKGTICAQKNEEYPPTSSYARIDDPDNGKPGLFTDIKDKAA